MSVAVELRSATALFTGVTEGDLGRTSGEPDAVVVANRATLLEQIGPRSVTVPQQVHGATVARTHTGAGYTAGAVVADALVTTERDLALGVHVADCLPIVVAGGDGLAVIHAGWRGLAAGVIGAAVRELRASGVRGALEAVIGPGAGGCCYETGPEVHELFAAYGASRGRLLDLRAVAAAQLRAAGVQAIDDVGPCTLCAPRGLLFSHRRDGPQTGRQAGLAWLC